MEDEREGGAGKDGLGGIEFGKQLLDGLIVSGLGEMVEPDRQSVGGQVGDKIGFILEDPAQ